MKNYEVRLTGFCSVLVIEAESKEKAIEAAMSEANSGDFEVDESSAHEVQDEQLDSHRRHANLISEP